jgi:hypothetical protein
MRFIAALLTCVAVVLTLAGCDPVTERRYITEGAGVDLYTADRANQVELQNQYVRFICDQAGPDCGGSWGAFVQAGMNDIDLRCDGFLTWIDARRRDKEPILSEITAIGAAAHTIMTVSGAGSDSLDIVTAAMALASATYSNWNSRLLLAINQSTIQDTVYTNQGKFREKIKDYRITDRPFAIYLLRNYLRLCMPTTIEANINTSATLAQLGAPEAAQESTVIKSVAPPVRHRANFVVDVNNAGDLINGFIHPNGTLKPRDPTRTKLVTDFMSANGIGVSLTSFLRSPEFAEKRTALARQLNLIH